MEDGRDCTGHGAGPGRIPRASQHIDGDRLTVAAVGPPNSGGSASIVLGGASVSYSPPPNFNGLDEFVYTVSDGSATATATVRVSVNGANDAPSAVNDHYSVAEDNVLTQSAPGVLGNDYDVDEDTLTAEMVNGPSQGTLTFNERGGFTYTPNANYFGADSFTYGVYDGTTWSAVATVSLTVLGVNDVPVAVDDSASVEGNSSDNSIDVLVNDSDVDSDNLVITSVSGPAHGSASISGSRVLYNPASGYSGSDSFSYTVQDSGGAISGARVNVTVSKVSAPPSAGGGSLALMTLWMMFGAVIFRRLERLC